MQRQGCGRYLLRMSQDNLITTPLAAASITDGRVAGFSLHLANFDGPFDLLLQLISRHKMDITEIALGAVTDEFISYIKQLENSENGWDLDKTTEFLVVAATLLDLKAAKLLPSGEVDDEADLALLEARDLLFARLMQYRAFKEIAAIFSDRIEREEKSFARLVALEPHFAQLLPEVLIGVGAQRFAAIANRVLTPKTTPIFSIDHLHQPLVIPVYLCVCVCVCVLCVLCVCVCVCERSIIRTRSSMRARIQYLCHVGYEDTYSSTRTGI